MILPAKREETLDAVVNVRLTNSEKNLLISDARLASMNMSALIRARYVDIPIIVNTDHAVIKELCRLSELLKCVLVQNSDADTVLTASTLLAIRDYIEKMASK